MSELEKPGDDSIAHLHRMSTTAGVVTQDYVAINGLAVLSAVLGIAGALAPIWPQTAVLLLLPAGAAILGLISFRQVRSSNRTQTGSIFSLAGIVLALAMGGVWGYQRYTAQSADEPDRREVARTISELSDLIKADKFEQAYPLFHASFRARVTPEQFVEHWKMRVASPPVWGHLQRIEPVAVKGSALVKFETISGQKYARLLTVVTFQKGQFPDRKEFVLVRDTDDRFRIVATTMHDTRPASAKGDEEEGP